MWLLADVGGTSTRLASLDSSRQISAVEVIVNERAENLTSIFSSYLGRERVRHDYDGAAIAVAGPVSGDLISLTNRSWSFDRTQLREELALSKLEVINDFAANALALPTLNDSEWVAIGNGEVAQSGNMIAIGPGTGLGVSALVHVKDNQWVPVQGEGGHVNLAPASERESQLIELARKRIGHVSAESFLSGTGLPLLYDCVASCRGARSEKLQAHEIGNRAMAGDESAVETMEHFYAMLGTVAGDLALTFMSTGGVYIGGGILPRFQQKFIDSAFRSRFEEKGRHQEIVKKIPTRLITTEIPAFRGLATLMQ